MGIRQSWSRAADINLGELFFLFLGDILRLTLKRYLGAPVKRVEPGWPSEGRKEAQPSPAIGPIDAFFDGTSRNVVLMGGETIFGEESFREGASPEKTNKPFVLPQIKRREEAILGLLKASLPAE